MAVGSQLSAIENGEGRHSMRLAAFVIVPADGQRPTAL
jgi:hypothetical protein